MFCSDIHQHSSPYTESVNGDPVFRSSSFFDMPVSVPFNIHMVFHALRLIQITIQSQPSKYSLKYNYLVQTNDKK
jgi:hypothetical protein